MKALLEALESQRGGVSNHFIDDFLKHGVGLKSFVGTFSCDRIPPWPGPRTAMIVNLSKELELGSHFVALYYTGPDCYYFDSYGRPLANLDIQSRVGQVIEVNGTPIQTSTSYFCGLYCIGFVLAVLKRQWSPQDFLRPFYPYPTVKNDEIVTEWIRAMMK